jgi:putative isomerase
LFRFTVRFGTLAAGCCFLWAVLTTASISEPIHAKPGSPEAFSGTGWNTWDIERPNAMIYMPDGIVLELSIYNSRTGLPLGRLFLSDVQHFGTHAPDGSYSFARYQQGGLTFEVEFAVSDNRLIAHVHPLNQGDYILVAEISFAFNRHGLVEKQGERLLVTGKNSHFRVASPNSQIFRPVVSNEHRLVWDLTGDRWVILTSNPQAICSEADCRTLVEENRKTYETNRVRSGGILSNSAQAASDAASWNIVWNVRGNLPVATVAREFPAGTGITWGGYIQGGWDAVFQSLQADLQSEPLAEASLIGLLADATSNGFVPNAGTGWGVTENRSEPPIAAYAALKLYRKHGNREFLEKAFPILYRWHQWWPTARDGNHNGLLEWGSQPVDTPSFIDFINKEIAGLIGGYKHIGVQPPEIKISDLTDNLAMAGDESGLDNSPMWDGVKFNKQSHTMEQDDVGLSSFWALDAWALAEIAHVLGLSQQEKSMRQDFLDMSSRVNKLMWSEEDGMYLNRFWDGSFNRRISPTNFYPLLAGIASPDKAQRMVRQYLLNPKKFWGEYVLPSAPRDDPAFQEQQYWRGRIWGPTNYLVYEGLKRNGMDEAASEVATKSTILFLKEWQEKGHIHENYNAISGVGDDVIGSSVKYYAWGGLLPLTMVEELIDVEPWESGLRLGSLSEESASISNIRIGDDLYDVFIGPGLRVMRNGENLLESDHPVVLRNVSWKTDCVRFDVSAKSRTHFTLYGFRIDERIHRTLPSDEKITANGGKVKITVDPGFTKMEILRNSINRKIKPN